MFFCLILASTTNARNIQEYWRSADPCEKWQEWSEGEDHLVIPALQKGLASHILSPAETVFLSAKENGANPVLLLALLENQQNLISVPEVVDTFEKRLFFALGFALSEDSQTTPYGGFFPQLVATSFQLQLDYQRELTFSESYQKHFQKKDWENITLLYSWYAREFSELSGIWHDDDPNSMDVFIDFTGPEMNPFLIQIFLEKRGSALANRALFRKLPIDDSIDYSNPPCE